MAEGPQSQIFQVLGKHWIFRCLGRNLHSTLSTQEEYLQTFFLHSIFAFLQPPFNEFHSSSQ